MIIPYLSDHFKRPWFFKEAHFIIYSLQRRCLRLLSYLTLYIFVKKQQRIYGMPKFAASTFFLSYEVLSFKLSIKKIMCVGFFQEEKGNFFGAFCRFSTIFIVNFYWFYFCKLVTHRLQINFRLRFFKRKYMFFFRKSFYSNKRIRELNNQKFQNLDT